MDFISHEVTEVAKILADINGTSKNGKMSVRFAKNGKMTTALPLLSNIEHLRSSRYSSHKTPQEEIPGTIIRKPHVTAKEKALVKQILLRQKDSRTLDLSTFTRELDQSSLVNRRIIWELSQRLLDLRLLKLSGWQAPSTVLSRSLVLLPGKMLEQVDLSNVPALTSDMLHTLIIRCFNLRHLNISGCPLIKDELFYTVSKMAETTLIDLNISSCRRLGKDTFFWLAGTNGVSAGQCRHLTNLNASHCPNMKDEGLVALAGGCKKFRFLNFSNCPLLTVVGVGAMVKNCGKQLQVLHLKGCLQLTDAALRAISKYCAKLRSLDVSRCHRLTDKGLRFLGRCGTLQSLDLSGCFQITEVGLCHMADGNIGLQFLNVTGLDEVTETGILELVKGLHHVEVADTFFGFQPKVHHVADKLQTEWATLKLAAICKIQAVQRMRLATRRVRHLRHKRHVQLSQKYLQPIIRGMLGRRAAREQREFMKGYIGALRRMQCAWRQFAARKRVRHVRWTQQLETNMPYIIRMQACYRAQKARRQHEEVLDLFISMRKNRAIEEETAVAVRMQAIIRRRRAAQRFAALMEEMKRRWSDELNASKLAQSVARMHAHRRHARKMKASLHSLLTIYQAAALRVQTIYRGLIGRRLATLMRHQRQVALEVATESVQLLQRVYRGLRGRRLAMARRCALMSRNFAATKLQKIYRGRKVLSWKDVHIQHILWQARKNTEAQMVQATHAVERRKMFADSASEDSGEDSYDWVEEYDEQMQAPFWFSPMRGERKNVRPLDTRAHERSLIGHRVKVKWHAEGKWFEGKIVKYHATKKRHKIVYGDGDRDWMNLKDNANDIMFRTPAGWCMFKLIRPGWQMESTEEQLNMIESQKGSYNPVDYAGGSETRAGVEVPQLDLSAAVGYTGASGYSEAPAQATQLTNEYEAEQYPTENEAGQYPTENEAEQYPTEYEAGQYPTENEAEQYPTENEAGQYPAASDANAYATGLDGYEADEEEYPVEAEFNDGGYEGEVEYPLEDDYQN